MESRVKKSVNNMVFGIAEQILTQIASFVCRTVFIKVLDANLLGVNGLFTNILSILSLAELGFGASIIYSMYKPIACGDKKKIAAFMNYYKKVYNILAVIVLVLGIAIIPFLKYIVNTEIEMDHLLFYYLIFLADSVCSYLLANRVAIIRANQNANIISKYNTVFVLLKNILQIITLIIFKNFIVYLLIQLVTTLFTNLYGAVLAKKMYPYAFEKQLLEKKEKKKLIENVKSMAIYGFGGKLMNQTDNILMSMICGTVYVGYYSNYNLIMIAINNFVNIIFNSITASVGNLNAGNEREKKIKIFFNIEFFSNWVHGFCAISLFMLFNPFIKIWCSEEYIFPTLVVFSIVLDFYIKGVLSVIVTYRNTTGLFRETKYIYLLAVIINLTLSIILGKLYGVFGIIIASSIARLLTNTWFEPYKLFKIYFKQSSKKYFIDRIFNIILIIISIVLLSGLFYVIDSLSKIEIISFVIKVALTAIIPNIIFYIGYSKKEEYQYFKQIMYSFVNKIIRREKNEKNSYI